MKHMRIPFNVSELKSNLGLALFYYECVPNLSTMTNSLYELLK